MEIFTNIFDDFIQQLPFVGVILGICVWFYIQNNKQINLMHTRHEKATEKAHDKFAETLAGINDETHAHSDKREEQLAGLTKRVVAELENSRKDQREQMGSVLETLQKIAR